MATVLVAFAAETSAAEQALASARAKLTRKGADLIVLNDVSAGQTFGSDLNTALVIDSSGILESVGRSSKDALADVVFDLVVGRLDASRVTPEA